MGKYTPGEIIRVCEMREAGKTYRQIARITGMNASSVAFHCMSAGAIPNRPLRAGGRTSTVPHYRNGKMVQPFTEADDDQIRAMSLQRVRPTEMARRVNRPLSSIRNRLLAIAFRDAKAEAA